MKYIDLSKGFHSAEEHYKIVNSLLAEGYIFTYNTFGNPHFMNIEDKTKEDVCIISSIIDDSGYFKH